MGRTKGSKNKPKELIIKDKVECVEEAKQIIEEILFPKKMIQGWVNVYKDETDTSISYYTGSDIHPTIEGAKYNAQRNVIGQAYISIEDK